MSALGDIVSNAVDAVTGSSSGTDLQQFLEKFSSSSGRYIDTIDPRGTFDVKFKFYPCDAASKSDDSTWLGRLGNSLLNSAKSIGTNLLDNVTGGLFSSAMDSTSSVKEEHNKFSKAGKHTFMEYLAPANGLQGGEQWSDSDQANCPLELNLGFYVQQMSIPQLAMGGESKSQTMLGEFPINGGYIQANGELTMTVINTKASLHERIFYPWMREVTLPFWSYDTQPYTTATVTVDFTKHNDIKYVFLGVRPKQITSIKPTQNDAGGENIEREITFMFDYMFVISDMAINDSVGSKLLGTASSLLGGASKMMNIF